MAADPLAVRAAVLVYAVEASGRPARAAPVPGETGRVGALKFATAARITAEELQTVIAAGAVATNKNMLAVKPFTVDVTSTPGALAEQLVSVAEIARAVRCTDEAAVEAALSSLALKQGYVAVLRVTAGGAFAAGAYVLFAHLREAGAEVPRPPVGVREAAALLGISEDDATYLAGEGVLGEAVVDAAGGNLAVPRECVNVERVLGLLVPLDDLVADLAPLVIRGGVGDEPGTRSGLADRLHVVELRGQRVVASIGRAVVEKMIKEFDLTR